MRWTIARMKQANKAAGMHFFDPDTLRWWNSKIYQPVEGPGGVYFATSEFHNATAPARFSVRRWHPEDSSVETIGEIQGYATLQDAMRAVRALATGGAL